jgi:hypothetical protein
MDIPGKFRDYNHARAVVFEFIEIWYNRKRLYSGLHYKNPAEMGELLTNQHTTSVNGNGIPTKEDLLAVTHKVSLKLDVAREIYDAILRFVLNFKF